MQVDMLAWLLPKHSDKLSDEGVWIAIYMLDGPVEGAVYMLAELLSKYTLSLCK
jgi:hypothetical protein